MAIYEISTADIRELSETTFAQAGFKERSDLQRLLRDKIEVISPDTLIISEEFGDWEDSNRRVDLLGVDKDANLVVVELKRTEDGGHMELQALRYAAMVSAMTFEKAEAVFARYLATRASGSPAASVQNTTETHNTDVRGNGSAETKARSRLLEFLGWEEPDEDRFAQDVRIVLASAEFSKELTTAVMWLNDRDLDIRCVRLKPYTDGTRYLVDVQQLIPLPEAEDYQVQLREKSRKERATTGKQWNRSSFLADVGRRCGKDVMGIAEHLLDWVDDLGVRAAWGHGTTSCSFKAYFVPAAEPNRTAMLFRLWSTGQMVILLGHLQRNLALEDAPVDELRARLQAIPGINLSGHEGRLKFPLSELVDPGALSALEDAISRLVTHVTTHCAIVEDSSGN